MTFGDFIGTLVATTCGGVFSWLLVKRRVRARRALELVLRAGACLLEETADWLAREGGLLMSGLGRSATCARRTG